jgi:hypothetical protein
VAPHSGRVQGSRAGGLFYLAYVSGLLLALGLLVLAIGLIRGAGRCLRDKCRELGPSVES